MLFYKSTLLNLSKIVPISQIEKCGRAVTSTENQYCRATCNKPGCWSENWCHNIPPFSRTGKGRCGGAQDAFLTMVLYAGPNCAQKCQVICLSGLKRQPWGILLFPQKKSMHGPLWFDRRHGGGETSLRWKYKEEKRGRKEQPCTRAWWLYICSLIRCQVNAWQMEIITEPSKTWLSVYICLKKPSGNALTSHQCQHLNYRHVGEKRRITEDCLSKSLLLLLLLFA